MLQVGFGEAAVPSATEIADTRAWCNGPFDSCSLLRAARSAHELLGTGYLGIVVLPPWPHVGHTDAWPALDRPS